MLQGALLKRINFTHLCGSVRRLCLFSAMHIQWNCGIKITLKMFQNIYGHTVTTLKLMLLLIIVLEIC